MIVNASVSIDTSDLTNEQIERLVHHVDISRRVFAASVAGMVKGVRKYEQEPVPHYLTVPVELDLLHYWFPHIFSEAVDCANQTGLFADALGVEL